MQPDAPLDDGMAIVRAVTQALADAYHRHEMYERARHERHNRFSATMALVTLHGEHADITLVGDSGIRLNGERVMQVEKDLDLITSTLRQQAWPVIAEVTEDADLRETLSRQITWHGTRQALDALSPASRRLAPRADRGDVAGRQRRQAASRADGRYPEPRDRRHRQRPRRISKRSRDDPGIFLPRWLCRSRKPRLSRADRPRRA